jgi:FkbM family methyltransferase
MSALKVYTSPIDTLWRYVSGTGTYPTRVGLRTPIGKVLPTAFSHHDILTINEIFARHDYGDDRTASVVVDIGGNIGISALYFLTRNPTVNVYAFEPVPKNVSRLLGNLSRFKERLSFSALAVSTQTGEVEVGVEPTGRYGGIGAEKAETSIRVPAVSIVELLQNVLDREGHIDILKVDVEGLEQALLSAIPDELKSRIGTIYAETNYFGVSPFPSHYSYSQAGSIARLVRTTGTG